MARGAIVMGEGRKNQLRSSTALDGDRPGSGGPRQLEVSREVRLFLTCPAVTGLSLSQLQKDRPRSQLLPPPTLEPRVGPESLESAWPRRH